MMREIPNNDGHADYGFALWLIVIGLLSAGLIGGGLVFWLIRIVAGWFR